MSVRKRRPMFDRLMDKVVAGRGCCWVFTGAKGPKGHGVVGDYTGKVTGTHRVSWEHHYGPIPAGLFVCHTCDVPNCVNPAHLFLGTAADNNRDMREKGRHVHGARHWNAKLTESDVNKIWEMRGTMTQKAIGKHFGVDQSHIAYIYSGKHWPHLKRTA